MHRNTFDVISRISVVRISGIVIYILHVSILSRASQHARGTTKKVVGSGEGACLLPRKSSFHYATNATKYAIMGCT